MVDAAKRYLPLDVLQTVIVNDRDRVETSFGQLGLGNTSARGDQPGEMGAALPPIGL